MSPGHEPGVPKRSLPITGYDTYSSVSGQQLMNIHAVSQYEEPGDGRQQGAGGAHHRRPDGRRAGLLGELARRETHRRACTGYIVTVKVKILNLTAPLVHSMLTGRYPLRG